MSLYSLAVTVLEGAVEGVRQDSLTHELLERAAARLASLPPLPAADPLRDPRYAYPTLLYSMAFLIQTKGENFTILVSGGQYSL